VSSAWLSAAIQEFEQVTLDNGTELFRVWAHAQRGDDPEPRPVLETRGPDGTSDTYEPMSSGGDRRGLLRLAYAVPTERVGPATAFSLRLPDGYRIELPEPTPGENRDEPEDGQRSQGVEPESEQPDSRQPDDGARRRIAEVEQELGELRAAGGELQGRLAELAAERDAARLEADAARAERDAALQAAQAAHAERDEALKTTREQQAEQDRLTGRLRQLQARIELLRADAINGRPGADPRLRQLESEREQVATHVRALAELLSTDEHPGDPDGAVEPTAAPAEQLEAIRARAVREANEHAERELRRLRAGTLV
jgi:hypothetical protein